MTPSQLVQVTAAFVVSISPISPLRAQSADLTATKPFAEKLEEIRSTAGLPALGAAAAVDGRVVDFATIGVRRVGGKAPVTKDDLWHIGSITKSMTGTLAGVLVDQGRIRWDSTVGEVLGPVVKEAPEWKDVTLSQLLQHRAGAPEKPPAQLWADAWKQAGTARQQRVQFVGGLLSKPPDYPPGTEFHYSNQGYSIAGAMMERTMNASWEDLMKKHVFQPLGMKTASFGPPGKPGKDDQPLGHDGKGTLVPVEVGVQADNPPSIGPGGTVHCSLGDLLRYAQWHAGEPDPGSKLVLKPETRARLYEAPSGGDYAFGWKVTQRPWAQGTALTHNGSNTMWFAVIWLSPARKAAFAAVTNAASETAEKACDSAVAELIKRHLQ